MQACKLIMFYYACTHVRSRVWSGSAAKGVLRKRAQIGAPVRKGTLHRIVQINAVSYSKWGRLGSPVPGSRGPRKNWILYKFERKLAGGGPRKDGSGSRSAETY